MVYVCFAKENDAFCSLCRAYRSGKESDTGLYLSTFLAIPFAKVSEYFSNCQKGPSNWTRGYLYSVSDAALLTSMSAKLPGSVLPYLPSNSKYGFVRFATLNIWGHV